MAFTYSKLPDYLLDDLFGFQSANKVKDSTRYIAEDIMGDPFSNGNQVNFALGDVNISGTNEIKGDRVTMNYGADIDSSSGDTYLGMANSLSTTHALGHVVNRSGSIVGIGIFIYPTFITTLSKVTPRIRINGSNIISLPQIIIDTLPFQYKSYLTQLRNVNTFVANDVLSIFLDFSPAGSAIFKILSNIDIVYDT
jgi:hypothetical protein